MAIVTISSTLSFETSALISRVDVFSSGVLEDTSFIKPIYIIDNMPISEHNRKTNESIEKKLINVVKWNNRTGVYYNKQSSKSTFSFQWTMIPGKRQNTVDQNVGRDWLKELASDLFEHTLKVRNLDSNGLTPYTETTYNVLVMDYSETLVRRDLVGDDYYWDCSLTLVEV